MSIDSREWSPFNALLSSPIMGGLYCGTWHCNIPVWVSTVINSCSARKHGCKMATDKIAGDPCKLPKKKHGHVINANINLIFAEQMRWL